MRRIQDVHVIATEPLIAPHLLKNEMPVDEGIARTVVEARETIREILAGRDRRLLCIVGPCSIHDPDAAIDYARRLAKLKDATSARLYLVMRVYFEKPRTTVGWKGLINDPHMDDSCDMREGLRIARRLLLEINRLGLAAGTELLDPITPQYIADLVAWAAIGARTTESQTHREMASGLSMPVGFKNTTEGNLQVAINAIQSARRPHSFLGITQEGISAVIRTSGNPDTHVVLRGGRKPNYDAASIEECRKILAGAALEPRMMVDCSHAQTSKDFTRQPEVLRTLVDQVCAGSGAIMGAMVESNIEAGSQPRQLESRQAQIRRVGHRPVHRLADDRAMPPRRRRRAGRRSFRSLCLRSKVFEIWPIDSRVQRIGLWLFIVTSLVFLLSPVWALSDACYSMLLSESILLDHSTHLNRYQFPAPIQESSRCASPTGPIALSYTTYQLDRIDGNVAYCYPNGSSILSIPFVGVMNFLGVYPFDARLSLQPRERGIDSAIVGGITDGRVSRSSSSGRPCWF